jgi:hypothetical protein
MCDERRRAEACVDESAHHALGTREEPGTLTQGAPVFPGSSRLGIEPKTPGWLVQDPTTRQIGDLIPTIRGSGTHPWLGIFVPELCCRGFSWRGFKTPNYFRPPII